MKRDKTMTGAAGVYYVCAELSRQGHIALPTLRQTRGVDVLASSADGHRQVEIQVKTASRTERNWRLNEKAETLVRPSLFYVFVVIPDEGAPRFHVVPSAVVAEFTRRDHESWKTPQAIESMRYFHDREGAYRDRWDLLGLEGVS